MASIKAFQFTPAAVIRFSGEDHFDFLQGQGTADLRGMVGLCRYSLWLDHRGHIQGDGFILKESDEAMLLVSYATPASSLMAKFDRHIIADDVEMEDLSEGFVLLSTDLHTDSSLPGSCGFAGISEGTFSANADGFCFPGRGMGKGSVDFLVPKGKSPDLGEVEFVDKVVAEQLRISAGIPLVPDDMDDGSLNPLEAGIHSALSFDKGCYLGQEVVARVHRLGRQTRRLARFSSARAEGLMPGPLLDGDKTIGRVTSVVKSHDRDIALGWIRGRIEDGVINCGDQEITVSTVDPS